MQAKLIRIAIMAVVTLVATVFLVATGAFLCVALYQGLKIVWAPWLAALAAAVILFLVALVVLGIGAAIARAAEAKAKREAEKKGPVAARIGLEIGRLLGESAAGSIGKNPTRVLLGAVAVGFAFGAFPKLRHFVMGFLDNK